MNGIASRTAVWIYIEEEVDTAGYEDMLYIQLPLDTVG